MEEVPGIPGALPSLAPYRAQCNLLPVEWQTWVEAWLMSIEVRLRLQEDHFSRFSFSQKASGVPFLTSYFREHPRLDTLRTSPREVLLHKYAYLLTKRLLLSIPTTQILNPYEMLEFILAANSTFPDVGEWRQTLSHSLFVQSPSFGKAFTEWKTSISKISASESQSVASLKQMSSLIRNFPKAGHELMKGSDYIESLNEIYGSAQQDMQIALTEHIYHSTLSLLSSNKGTASTLIDQLYLLKSESDRVRNSKPQSRTLLTSLICQTGFLRHLSADAKVNDSSRGRSLIDSLVAYREEIKHLHPLPLRRKTNAQKGKGKGKAAADHAMHIHQAAQLSEIQDLFPHLPTGYILRLLDHFNNNIQQVTEALLEPDILPPHLQDQNAPEDQEISDALHAPPDLAPRSTPPLPPQRKNIFDDDDFDNLQISFKNIHRGRKDIDISAPASTDERTRSKAAIMSALAHFDSDDDERDDSYDVADVGGSMDQSVDTDSRPKTSPTQDPQEEVLFRAWKDNKELFARDSKTRASPVRQQLKRDINMTDEQLEGWALMLERDKQKQDKLTKRYSAVATFRGDQKALGQSRWQQDISAENSNAEGDGTDDEPRNAEDPRRMGQAGMRGNRDWGNRGRGRGGGSAGGSKGSSQSHAIKHNKQHGGYRGGRGGAHNQREGRARKFGRGMGAAPES